MCEKTWIVYDLCHWFVSHYCRKKKEEPKIFAIRSIWFKLIQDDLSDFECARWLAWAFQKLLICCDFHTQPSLECTENCQKKRKHPASSSSLSSTWEQEGTIRTSLPKLDVRRLDRSYLDWPGWISAATFGWQGQNSVKTTHTMRTLIERNNFWKLGPLDNRFLDLIFV